MSAPLTSHLTNGALAEVDKRGEGYVRYGAEISGKSDKKRHSVPEKLRDMQGFTTIWQYEPAAI